MRFDNTTIALLGDTGRGKSYLIGEYSTHLRETKKQRTVVYISDRGWRTLLPQIKSGIILPVALTGDPFDWLNHAIKGEIKVADKWVKAPDDIGMFAYESGSQIGNELNRAIRESHSAGGTRVGEDGRQKTMGIGPAANTYKVAGQTHASLDKGHFGIMQNEIRDAIWQSQELPGVVLWTFLALRKKDDDTNAEMIGPDAGAGKALTGALPSWFHYCFHVDSIVTPGVGNLPSTEEHVLYMGSHTDISTGNARVVSNSRVPFGAEAMPSVIKPASLVKALEMLEGRQVSTAAAFSKKYGV